MNIIHIFAKTRLLSYGTKFYKADLHFHIPASKDARGSNCYGFNPRTGSKSISSTIEVVIKKGSGKSLLSYLIQAASRTELEPPKKTIVRLFPEKVSKEKIEYFAFHRDSKISQPKRICSMLWKEAIDHFKGVRYATLEQNQYNANAIVS